MHGTGRTPLFQQLQRTLRKARLGSMTPPPRPARELSRRAFMAATAAALLASYTRKASAKPAGPRIAVVGRGIAGLNATYLLAKAGFNVTLYEGRTTSADASRRTTATLPAASTPNSAASSSTPTTTTCSPWPRRLAWT